jgi:hypothetical protein
MASAVASGVAPEAAPSSAEASGSVPLLGLPSTAPRLGVLSASSWAWGAEEQLAVSTKLAVRNKESKGRKALDISSETSLGLRSRCA